MNNYIEVLPNLFLGNLLSLEDKLFIDTLSEIINISNKSIPSYIQDFDLKTTSLNILDELDQDISQYFDLTYQIISKNLQESKKILVYCQMGRSRSVTIILNYLMTKEKICYEMAFIRLLYVKSEIGPNKGFVKQLKDYRKKKIGKNYLSQQFLDYQDLHELKFNLEQKLSGKKSVEEWERLRKEREIERYLNSLDFLNNKKIE